MWNFQVVVITKWSVSASIYDVFCFFVLGEAFLLVHLATVEVVVQWWTNRCEISVWCCNDACFGYVYRFIVNMIRGGVSAADKEWYWAVVCSASQRTTGIWKYVLRFVLILRLGVWWGESENICWLELVIACIEIKFWFVSSCTSSALFNWKQFNLLS